MMDEQLRDTREEISYIKSILEKTADGLKTVAPWFIRLGILWLIYGILQTAQSLLPPTLPLSAIQAVSQILGVIGWAFYILLAVSFFIGRHHLSEKGGHMLGLKLMDIWGLCILLFLFLNVVISVALWRLATSATSFLPEHINRFETILAVCRSCLIFVLPLLPLLITASFLDNRRMLLAGIVLTVLAVVILGAHSYLLACSGAIELSVSNSMKIIYTFISCLMDIAPGLMLLYVGRALKRG